MNSSNPRLSVIITAYNQERYLGEAIESVLAQDFDDLEIIVVDDGSTDKTATVAARYDVKVISQPNAGPGAALNTGVTEARGELIAFLDGDDVWVPGTLANRIMAFDRDPGLDATQGMLVEFLSPELPEESGELPRVNEDPVPGPVAGTTMITRDGLDRVGAFETEHKLGSFMEWLIRAKDAGLVLRRHDQLFLRRRIHDDNIGLRERDSRNDYVKILKAALDRRRARE